MIDVRLRLMMVCLAVLGLLVFVDGLLNGPWWRIAAGALWTWAFGYLALKGPGILVPRRVKDSIADQLAQAAVPARSWPLIFGGVLLAFTFALVAALFLFAPWELVEELFSSRRSDWPGALRSAGGEWFARIALAAISLVAAGAAAWTVRARLRA